MRRTVLALALTAAALAAPLAQAANPRHPRHEKARYVYRSGGIVAPRVVYRGYYHNLPAPAYLYYGYPGNGFSYGPGF